MLGSQYFRRCHQTGLVAIVNGHQHGHQSHHRFAAAHIALQQTVHLEAGTQVCPDFFEHALLGIGKGERQFFIEKPIEFLTNHFYFRSFQQLFSAIAFSDQLQLQKEKFFKLYPVLGEVPLVFILRKMYPSERCQPVRKVKLLQQVFR